VKDAGLGGVGENSVAVRALKVFNLVFAKAPRSAEMKVARVFVAKSAMFDFCPLALISGNIIVLLAELLFSKEAEAIFEGGKGCGFLPAGQGKG
jgi:hypothetical protein